MQDNMIDSERISPEPDIKENISSLIKKEPLTEEQHNLVEKMIDSDQISPEPDIKDDISRWIKEEPLTEEVVIKDDPDDVETITIEQNITSMIVPKAERKMSGSELFEGLAMESNERTKDDITGSFKNECSSCVANEESALSLQQSKEGQVLPPPINTIPYENRDSPSCASAECVPPSSIKNSYLCNECGENFSNRKTLKSHEIVHSKGKFNVKGQFLFVCKKCDRSFPSYKGLQVHRARCGKAPKPCCCDELGIPCSFESNKKDSQNTNLPFCCCVCGKYYLLKRSLKDHMPTHSTKRVYNCDQCSCAFKYRNNMIRHFAIHENGRSYTCIRCSMCFSRKYTLDKHMNTHTNERPYTCNECGLAFKSRQVLVDHCIIHSKVESYNCKSCPRAFRSRKSLYDHKIRTHTERRLYTCNDCMQTFYCRRAIIRHLSSHSNA